MKEATGEANMTVVTIILIAAIVAIATPIVNSMMKNTGKKACCMNNDGVWQENNCYKTCNVGADGKSTCTGSVSVECKDSE